MSKEEYIERTIRIMQQLNAEMLKKVYTVARTLFDISQEKQAEKGGRHGRDYFAVREER